MIQDVDETLRNLLLVELALLPDAIILEPEQITFSSPTGQTTQALETVSLNLYLYAANVHPTLHNQFVHRPTSPSQQVRNAPPPLLDLYYLVTVDAGSNCATEHRLLSQVLMVLLNHPIIPSECYSRVFGAPNGGRILCRILPQDSTTRDEMYRLWGSLAVPSRLALLLQVTAPIPSDEPKPQPLEIQSAESVAVSDEPLPEATLAENVKEPTLAETLEETPDAVIVGDLLPEKPTSGIYTEEMLPPPVYRKGLRPREP